MTIESIAARAGVGKSTIYRHWPDKLALIADAFETFHEQMVPDLGDLPVRESVALLLRHVAEVVVDSTFSRCIPALIEGAERDPRVREFHHRYSAERRQALIDLIARGIREGEVGAERRSRAGHDRAARRDLLPAALTGRPARPGRRTAGWSISCCGDRRAIGSRAADERLLAIRRDRVRRRSSPAAPAAWAWPTARCSPPTARGSR